jgi:hypothetical protein
MKTNVAKTSIRSYDTLKASGFTGQHAAIVSRMERGVNELVEDGQIIVCGNIKSPPFRAASGSREAGRRTNGVDVMDEIELEFFDGLCIRSRSNPDDIGMAANLIAELHSAIKEGRQLNASYQQVLDQFLALNDVLQVQLIEWFPRSA